MSTTPQTKRRRTFAELNGDSGLAAPRRCRRCGDYADHRLALTVKPLTAGQRPKPAPAVVRAAAELCETCAVDVYEVVAKAVRA